MKSGTSIKVGIWICIGAACILVAFGAVTWCHGHQAFFGTEKTKPEGWGDYGSYLQGTTASLWSLAGFFLILVAFLAQKQQLILQQRQFEQQSFENHFFQLLTYHNNIVDKLQDIDSSTEGRSVFFILWAKVQAQYHERLDGPIENDTEALAISCYENVFDERPELLGHYFRNLYHIIKFVHESEHSDKKRYTSLVRAQLSSYEHVLLHYNGLSMYGSERFKPRIEEYALLENMGPGLLMNPKHPTSYSPKAFGEDAAQFVFQDVGPHPAQSPPPANGSKPA